MAVLQPSPFGALLKRFRLAANLTQEQVAERSGVSVRGISDLERGARHSPHRATVRLLADALDLFPRERSRFEAAAGRADELISCTHFHQAAHEPTFGPPFVGRAAQLTVLDSHITGIGPPLLLCAGEPGIGKSRFLQEARHRATAAGMTVLVGGCMRPDGQEPYTPMLQALLYGIDGLSPRRLRAVVRECAWLTCLVPELLEVVQPPLPLSTMDSLHEHGLLYGAVIRFLELIGGPSGVLLVLDDLQWAGADALALLTALLYAGSTVPLRVLGAYRDTEISSPLWVTLGELAQAQLARHLVLPPLAEDEAALLLDELVGYMRTENDAALDRILRRTGGIPFLVVSCAVEMRLGMDTGGQDSRVPWNVAQSIRRRVAELSEVGQQVLAVASLVGRECPRSLLLNVVEHPASHVLDQLDQASRAHLLAPREGNDYQFPHDLIREVVAANIGAGQRSYLHHRIGMVLEGLTTREERAAEVAWHFLEANSYERALPHVLKAGDQSEAVFAHSDAENHYRMAITIVQKLPRDYPRRWEIEGQALQKLAAVLAMMERNDEARAIYEQAGQLFRQINDAEAAARADLQIAVLDGRQGRPTEGLVRTQLLQELLETTAAPRARAELQMVRANLLFASGDPAQSVKIAEQASDLALAIGDNELLAESEVRRGTALALIEGRLQGIRVLESVIPLAQEVRDVSILARAYGNLATEYEYIGRLSSSQEYFQRAVKILEPTGSPGYTAFALVNLAGARILQGNWRGARVLGERARDMARPLGLASVSSVVMLLMGKLCLLEGEWDEADACLYECLAWLKSAVTSCVTPVIQEEAQCLAAELDLGLNRPEEARLRLTSRSEYQGPMEAAILAVLATAYIELGRVKQAENTVTRALAITHDRCSFVRRPDVLRVQGMVSAHLGHWAQANVAFDKSVSLARVMPNPYAQARALFEWGCMYIAKPDREQAHVPLKEALRIFQRLGATPYVDRTERALASLS